jgi:hypothetical protein
LDSRGLQDAVEHRENGVGKLLGLLRRSELKFAAKPQKMKCVGHVTHMYQTKNSHKKCLKSSRGISGCRNSRKMKMTRGKKTAANKFPNNRDVTSIFYASERLYETSPKLRTHKY